MKLLNDFFMHWEGVGGFLIHWNRIDELRKQKQIRQAWFSAGLVIHDLMTMIIIRIIPG